MAVTAFSAKALQDAGVRDYGDFVALTPNVSLVEPRAWPVLPDHPRTHRGAKRQAPVAFVVDGVQESSNRQFTQAMFDLESVQVLMGPQGALYGRNASGRRHRHHHKQPTNEFQGYVQAGGGSAAKRRSRAW